MERQHRRIESAMTLVERAMPKVHDSWTVLPHEPIEAIDEGLLTVAGDIPMPLGNFPRRMTVIGLGGHRTAIWSAIALDAAEMARIEALGRPSFLIIPNRMHRLDAKIWKARYPGIKVLAPPGARSPVEEVVPVDATNDIIGDRDVALVVAAGTKEGEFALTVKRASGTTLIVNDLIGHVRHPRGFGAQVMARLMGFGVSGPRVPRVVKRMMIKDRPALARQLRDWAAIPDLRRVIVSHGDPIEDRPAAALTAIADSLE
jgi:hypothetical protein